MELILPFQGCNNTQWLITYQIRTATILMKITTTIWKLKIMWFQTAVQNTMVRFHRLLSGQKIKLLAKLFCVKSVFSNDFNKIFKHIYQVSLGR